MAITNGAFVRNTSGSVGKELVFKKYYDKTVVSKMPDMSKRVLSAKQMDSNERMRLANIYVKFIYKTEEAKVKARIRLKLPAHKSLYHALIKEHLDKHRHIELQELEKTFMDGLG